MKTSLSHLLLAACCALGAALNLAAADKKSPALQPLFNGRTLDGWTVKGGTATYRVEDGTIVGTTVSGSKNTFLCTTRDYADFIFECDVKCDPKLNSGIQIRSHTYAQATPQASAPKKQRESGEVYGYQCEIAEGAKGVSGNFWDEGRWTKWHDDLAKRPGATAAFKDGEWNHYRIVAQGDRIRSWVNGVLCADFRDKLDASGFIGLQVHSIPKTAGPYQVRWKNVLLRELKPGEKAD